MHVSRGFQCIGYNYVIRLDGTVEVGRSLTIDGAHCNSKGFSGVSYNKHSIGICYVAVWTRTVRQLTPERRNRKRR